MNIIRHLIIILLTNVFISNLMAFNGVKNTIEARSCRISYDSIEFNVSKILDAKSNLKGKFVKSNSGLTISLLDIFIKDDVIWFKISVTNRTSISYNFDTIQFEHSKGSNQNQVITPILPIVVSGGNVINAESHILLVYAFESYGFNENSLVTLHMFENKGERDLRLEIPAKVILNTKSTF